MDNVIKDGERQPKIELLLLEWPIVSHELHREVLIFLRLISFVSMQLVEVDWVLMLELVLTEYVFVR